MKWTNKFSLPETIYNAVIHDPYVREGEYSVTQLISPPQILQLLRRHDSEIERDVSDNLWMLLGSAIHHVLERAKPDNALKEESLKISNGRITISGRPDLYTAEGNVEDYKVTSVYAFLLGNKPEWEAQLNLYALLYREYGFKVNKLFIHAILRDWMQSKTVDEDYPQCPFISVEIPLEKPEVVLMYLEGRVMIHQSSARLPDDHLPECTDQERWMRPTTYAVKKKGNKRATKVFDTQKEAENMIAGSDNLVLEFRPGENVRCERFCDAKNFCFQYKRMNQQ
jgi:hypothetical protein